MLFKPTEDAFQIQFGCGQSFLPLELRRLVSHLPQLLLELNLTGTVK